MRCAGCLRAPPVCRVFTVLVAAAVPQTLNGRTRQAAAMRLRRTLRRRSKKPNLPLHPRKRGAHWCACPPRNALRLCMCRDADVGLACFRLPQQTRNETMIKRGLLLAFALFVAQYFGVSAACGHPYIEPSCSGLFWAPHMCTSAPAGLVVLQTRPHPAPPRDVAQSTAPQRVTNARHRLNAWPRPTTRT